MNRGGSPKHKLRCALEGSSSNLHSQKFASSIVCSPGPTRQNFYVHPTACLCMLILYIRNIIPNEMWLPRRRPGPSGAGLWAFWQVLVRAAETAAPGIF